jgi:hypothetical protein
MTEDREQLLEHYRQSRADLLAAVDGLEDQDLTEPSLDGWSIKDHFLHLASWDDIRASEVERISAGHDSAWRAGVDEEDGYNAISYKLRQGLSLAQARWELDRSRRRLLDAISAATERGLDASLYGEAALVSTHEPQHTEWIKRWRSERSS